MRGTHGTAVGQRRRTPGFTLIELMVTIIILAVIVAIAFPNYTMLMNSNRLSAASNDIVADLQLARSEAIRRNTRTIVCASADNATCAGGAGAWTGWITYVDSDGNNAPSAAEIVRVGSVKLPVVLQASAAITGNGNSVVIRADGLAHAKDGGLLKAMLSTCMTTKKPAENTRELSIIAGSRLATKAIDNDGTCPTPANERT